MFRFANPQLLWLLAVIPVAAAIYVAALAAKRRRLARFGNRATMAELMPDAAQWRNNLKFCILMAAVALAVIAAARPQRGSKIREEKSRGVEMVLAVDV